MATEKITMPQLGESVTEGTVSSWLVSEGDHVNKYDPIAEVMTDKVNAEVPSSFTGTIQQIVAKEGDTLDVGGLMCYIETEDTEEKDRSDADDIISTKQALNEDSEDLKKKGAMMKMRYSPAVLRLAEEHQIDLKQVSGSGRGGRITRKDIEKLIAKKEAPHVAFDHSLPKQMTDRQKEKASLLINERKGTTERGDVQIPVTGVRKAIAENMIRSKTEIPHAWMTVEVDVTDLVTYRRQIKDEFKRNEGFNLTYFAFFVKAVARSLKEFPQMNSMWGGENIIQKKDINLSIAVAHEQQLYVPVIKHADEKSIKGIAKDINELAMKARTGKLTQDDIQGGTFTVNNTGSFGSISSMGVINYPQAAILQVETIVKRPVIINDMFAARDIVNLSLSLDHRILDGLVCGQFLARVKEILENMNQQTMNVY
ncbi:MAG TPA: dihydrolipoamide acetyltransferase family protein [Bacillota bacterium]